LVRGEKHLHKFKSRLYKHSLIFYLQYIDAQLSMAWQLE
jgi:hypothetical protein